MDANSRTWIRSEVQRRHYIITAGFGLFTSAAARAVPSRTFTLGKDGPRNKALLVTRQLNALFDSKQAQVVRVRPPLT
jgi:hypothetical protein